MDSSDLFSFLDDSAQQKQPLPDANGDIRMETESQAKSTARKRKAITPPQPKESDTIAEASGSAAGPSEPKKPRLASPKPVVVDEVEIEAKREVAASAGLTGAVDAGSRLELRHQVKYLECPLHHAC